MYHCISKNKRLNQGGQSLVEYLILTSIIAIGSIGVVGAIQHNMGARFSSVSAALAGKKKDYKGAEIKSSFHNKKNLSNFMKDVE
jgi:Flp pilus assembly pilin Flp